MSVQCRYVWKFYSPLSSVLSLNDSMFMWIMSLDMGKSFIKNLCKINTIVVVMLQHCRLPGILCFPQGLQFPQQHVSIAGKMIISIQHNLFFILHCTCNMGLSITELLVKVQLMILYTMCFLFGLFGIICIIKLNWDNMYLATTHTHTHVYIYKKVIRVVCSASMRSGLIWKKC